MRPAILAAFVSSPLILFSLDRPVEPDHRPHAAPVFEINTGQIDRRVRFLSRGPGYTLFLTDQEAIFATPRDRLSFALIGANSAPKVAGEDALEAKTNYFIGDDPRAWRTEIPNYRRAVFREVYPGIDLVYHSGRGILEHDFVVAPGGDPSAIAFTMSGGALRLDAAGDLIISAGAGELRMMKPKIYQEAREIAGRYTLAGTRVGFEVAPYDHAKPLIIDPVLAFSTYLGGSLEEQAASIAVDPAGNVYVAGYTYSHDFPTQSPLQAENVSEYTSAFISKMSPDGSTLIYSTYLGGANQHGWWRNNNNQGLDVAVNEAGEAVLVGMTDALDFPVVAAFQPNASASACVPDCPDAHIYYEGFVTKLNASGSGLVFSTYFGGGAWDFVEAAAFDAGGNVIIAGFTESDDFPTANAFQTARAGGHDAFVAKFGGEGALVYSSYLGGSDSDEAYDVAIDRATGKTYVAGVTYSQDFRIASAVGAPAGSGDAFAAELDPNGALLFSSYLGLFGFDSGRGIAVDGDGAIYVAGYATSYEDAVVTKVAADRSAIAWQKLIGGTESDTAMAIAADGAGNLYFAGTTDSPSFATADAIQKTNAGSGDAFLAIGKTDGSAPFPSYVTYLGGGAYDFATGVAVGVAGDVFVTGNTLSSDFPTANALESNARGQLDAFVVKISTDSPPPPPTITTTSLPSGVREVSYSATLEASGGQPPYTWSIESGALPAGLQLAPSTGVIAGTPEASGLSTFTARVQDAGARSASASFQIEIVAPALEITTAGLPGGTVDEAYSAALAATGGDAPYVWSISAGALPAGLTLHEDGSIDGVPTASGTTEFTVRVADAGSGSTTKVLSIAIDPAPGAPDFRMGADRTSASVVAGEALTFALEVTPVNGFDSAVTFACATPLARGVHCSFDPTNVTPAGAPATSALTVRTTGENTPIAGVALSIGLLAIAAVATRKRALSGLLLAIAATGVIVVSSCGGEDQPKPNPDATPKGTMSIRVDATSGTRVKSVTLEIVVR